MEFRKFRIKKSWWKYADASVYNEHNQFLCKVEAKGVFKTWIEMLNQQGEPFLILKPKGLGSSSYDFLYGSKKVGVFKPDWNGTSFRMYIDGYGEIQFKLNMWNNKISILTQGKELGMVSVTALHNEYGVAISEEVDPQYIIAGLILVSKVSSGM